MKPEWATSLRDQCKKSGVPFFFKQWGEWVPADIHMESDLRHELYVANPQKYKSAAIFKDGCCEVVMHRVGKKVAGALLEGVEYKNFPL